MVPPPALRGYAFDGPALWDHEEPLGYPVTPPGVLGGGPLGGQAGRGHFALFAMPL